MERKTKWHSCRLAPYGDSGRVRWCVGQERSWKLKLKVLVFVPLLLLLTTIIAILVTYVHQLKHNEDTKQHNAKLDFRDSEVTTNEDRNVLPDATTSYIPNDNLPISSEKPLIRHPREISDLRVKNNVSAQFDYDDLQSSESKFVSWYRSGKPVNPLHLLALGEGSYDERMGVFKRNILSSAQARKVQAVLMRQYMNRAVNPCEDFYEFSCGNWAKYNPMPPDKAGYDTFEILRESLDEMLRDLLSEEDLEEDEDIGFNFQKNSIIRNKSSKTKTSNHNYKHNKSIVFTKNPVSKAKHLYKSCINEELINRRAETPLLKLLKQLGGWPIVDSEWDETHFDWLYLVAQLRLYNNDVLISEWVGPDIKNSDEYIIQFDQTSLGLPTREYFLDDSNLKYLEAYRIYIITVANLLGASIVQATEDVDQIINFETELAKITASQDDRRNVSELYMKATVGELQATIPQIDWLRYLNLIMVGPIHSNQLVVCFSVPYYHDLVSLLSNTSSRTVANYLLWRFVRHRVNNLDKKFQDAKQRFYYVLFGREKLPPRWQTCVTQVNSNMGMALGRMFVQRYFDEISKNDTLQMTKEIKQSFRDILLETDWLDSNTKELARMKIDAMHLRIGYPEFILNLDELSERYKDVQIHPDLYFENTLSILQHLARSEQNRISTAVNKTLWNTAPAVVNAYYSRNRNQIMFPAGILQPPFYHRYFPRCLNYGGIGVVIGHEITHGFDDKGRLFDKEGNLQRWWRMQAIQEFHDRAQCLIDQYNTYVVPEVNMPVDGVNTQGENIADNGGIKQAYKAYVKWLKENPLVDDTLPGLNVTNKQLFFLNFAQVWCGTARPEATRNKIKTAVHSPGRFRVIGTLSNSQDFSEAYNCPSGSPMNPKKKCSIW
ncbi:hypothetical protein RN001_016232 [Aquatica leii]|uniref:Neprilysin-4-like n=1 Tax=Aquatica leii TaxID=1421715 RepID=A0AAN7P035_9COLE|nr:hypothetical protein RN001_016232 [Aquatica leii]